MTEVQYKPTYNPQKAAKFLEAVDKVAKDRGVSAFTPEAKTEILKNSQVTDYMVSIYVQFLKQDMLKDIAGQLELSVEPESNIRESFLNFLGEGK